MIKYKYHDEELSRFFNNNFLFAKQTKTNSGYGKYIDKTIEGCILSIWMDKFEFTWMENSEILTFLVK